MKLVNNGFLLNMGDVIKLLKAHNLPIVKARVFKAKKKWTKETISANLNTLRNSGLLNTYNPL